MIQWEWGGGLGGIEGKKEPLPGVRGSAVKSEITASVVTGLHRYSLFLKQVLLLLSVGFYGVLR